MKYSIPTNWQDDLCCGLTSDNGLELYGQMGNDVIGGGRASAIVPQVSQKKAQRHIRLAYEKGFSFNYLLNGTCFGDAGFLQSQKQNILAMLNWLVSSGVGAVTISSPFLCRMIRKHAPGLKIYVSVQQNVNNLFQLMQWEDMGVDKITLSVLDVNRNFSLLEKIRKNVKCDLQLIANLKCLMGCHAYHCHSNLHSHGSQSGHVLKGFLIDYYSVKCNYERLNHPVELIKSLWIRPEDVHFYEEAGVKWLKLVGREMKTDKIIRIFNAYKSGKYEGNLLDLLPTFRKNHFDFKKIKSFLRYFFRPQYVNILSLYRARNIFKEDGIYLDNKKLGNFLEYFLQGKCNLDCGYKCNYCQSIADQAITIDYKYRNRIIKESRSFLKKLVSADLYNYL